MNVKVQIDGLALKQWRNLGCFLLLFETEMQSKMTGVDVRSLYTGESPPSFGVALINTVKWETRILT